MNRKIRFNVSQFFSTLLLEASIIFLILFILIAFEVHLRGLLILNGEINTAILSVSMKTSLSGAFFYAFFYRLLKMSLVSFFGLFSVASNNSSTRPISEYLTDIYLTIALLVATLPIRPVVQNIYLDTGMPEITVTTVRFDAIPTAILLFIAFIPLALIYTKLFKGVERTLRILFLLLVLLIAAYVNKGPNYGARVSETRAAWITQDWDSQSERGLKSLEDAETAIEKAVAYYWLGVAENRKGNYEAAVDYQKKAIEKDPLYGPPYSSISTAYRLLGELDKAKENAERCIDIMPEYAWCYYAYAGYYGEIGDSENAWKNISKAYSLDPKSPDIKSTYEWAKAYYNK